MEKDNSETNNKEDSTAGDISQDNVTAISSKPENRVVEPGKPDIEEPGVISLRKNRKYWIFAICLFFFISLVPIINLIGNFNKCYIGGAELEGWLWRYWWMKKLLSSLWAQYPRDWGMIFYVYFCAGNYPETGNVFNLQTFSLLLEPIFGSPAYYNVKVILIMFLNGLAGYALCKYLTKRPIISMLGGAILALNPYVAYEIGSGRPRQAMLFSMALFAMYVIDNYRTLSLKSSLLAGFWLGITAAIYLFYGMAALLFGLIFLLYHLIADYKNFTFTFAKYVIVMLVIFMLISGPFCYRYIELVLMREKLPEVTYGRDFPSLNFLLSDPGELNPRDFLSQSIMRYRYGSLPANFPFHLTYLINLPLIITILILLPLPFIKLGSPPASRLHLFWIIILLFFYILSLGPYLQLASGESRYYVRLLSGEAVPLLYVVFFKYIPFFARLFEPLRMLGMFYIAAIVILVTNVQFFVDQISKAELEKKIKFIKALNLRHVESALVFTIIILTIAQMFITGQIPFNLWQMGIPDIYLKLKNQQDDFGIVEVPFRTGDYVNFYQIFHNKKLLWSWTYGSIPPNFPDSEAKYLSTSNFLENNTFVRCLEEMNRTPDIPPFFQLSDLEKITEAGYRYLIVHERGCLEVNQERGKEIFDYLVTYFSKRLGDPLEMGTETFTGGKWLIPEKTAAYRLAVFRIP